MVDMEQSGSMAWMSTLLALLFLPHLVIAGQQTERSDCPVAEAGRPYSLWCPVSVNRPVEWTVNTPNGETQTRWCPPDTPAGCYFPKPIGAKVSYHVTKHGLQSRLIISRVKVDQDNSVYTCSTVDDPGQAIVSCRLHVILKPTSSSCKTISAGSNKIRLQCFADRVFPALACRVIQRDLSHDKEIQLPNQTFQYERSFRGANGNGISTALCETDINDLQPGQYQFIGSLSPSGIHGQYLKSFAVSSHPTRTVTIARSDMHVSISYQNQWPIRTCPGVNTVVTLTCATRGFKSRPSIEWYVKNLKVKQNDYVVHGVTNGSSDVVSTYSFVSESRFHGATILCLAKALQKRSYDTVKFSATWPPDHVPQFRDEQHRLVKLTVNLTQGDVVPMMCLVKGGRPEVMNVQVLCYKDTERLTFSASKGNFTSFVLNGTKNFDRGLCICRAKHETNCYHSMTILSINVNPVPASQKHSSTLFDHYYIVLIVISAVALLIITIFGIEICKTKCALKTSHSYYFNGKHIYETVDSVDTFLPRSSSNANLGSMIFTRNDRRGPWEDFLARDESPFYCSQHPRPHDRINQNSDPTSSRTDDTNASLLTFNTLTGNFSTSLWRDSGTSESIFKNDKYGYISPISYYTNSNGDVIHLSDADLLEENRTYHWSSVSSVLSNLSTADSDSDKTISSSVEKLDSLESYAQL